MTARLLLFLLLLSSFPAAAQIVRPYRVPVEAQGAIDTTGLTTAQPPPSEPLHIAHYAEEMPTFVGGLECLFCFLYRHNRLAAPSVSYPTGRAFIGFVVDTAGQVRDVRLLKGLHPTLDAEALRLVRLLSGHFTPGYQNKRPVAVPFTLPIQFPPIVPDKKQLKRCR